MNFRPTAAIGLSQRRYEFKLRGVYQNQSASQENILNL